jgi:hypothetical protein
VPAQDVESLVIDCVARVTGIAGEEVRRSFLRRVLARVEIHPTSVQLVFPRTELFIRRSDPRQELVTIQRRLAAGESVAPDISDPSALRVTIAVRMQLRGGRSWIIGSDGRSQARTTGVDPVLVGGLRSAHALLSASTGAPLGLVESAILDQAPPNPYERKLIRLAFLAPQIQRDILEGKQPPGLTLEQLIQGDIPAAWERQIERLA